MRRLHLTVAAAVSFVSIVTTATSVLAVSSAATPYGVLRPQDGWKVGTVDTAGAPYCAMVGKFDKQVVVAFARNVDGFGSVALDFKDSFFKAGEEYEVSLKADGIKNRTLVGRASSERSIVVQIGRDDAFYDMLSNNGELVIGMPMLEVTFALRQFSGAHKNLETCAAKLEKPADVVERNALAPIDREIEKLNSERTRLAAVGAEVAKLEKEVDSKTSSFDELEAQLEAEARAEAARSEETLAKIETEKTAIQSQLKDVAAIEPAAGDVAAPVALTAEEPSGGRKLLASMGAKMKALVPSSSGTSARAIEESQITVANADRAAEETQQALAEKDPETRAIQGQIAMLEAEKQRETSAQIDAFDRTQANLARETEKLVEARNRQMAALANTPEDKKTKVDLVTSQAKIAAVEETKKESAVDLTRTLASTKSDFEARIAALTTERDALKSELASAKSENTRLSGELTRQASTASTRDAGEIARLREQLASAEKAQQEEISRATSAAAELERARSEIATLREESKTELARLAALKDSLAAERASLTAMRDKMEKDQLAASQSVATATASTAEIAKERATLENLRLVLERKQADLDAQSARQMAEAESLKATTVTAVAIPTTAPQTLMESERAELSELRARIRSMEAGETISKAAPVTDNAELARLKDENKSLRDKLTAFLSSDKPAQQAAIEPTPVAEVAVPVSLGASVETTPVEAPTTANVPEAPMAIVPLDDKNSKSVEAAPAVKPTGIMAKLAVYGRSGSTSVVAEEKITETKPKALWDEQKVVAAPVEVVQKEQIIEPVAEIAALTAVEKSALAATEPAAGASAPVAAEPVVEQVAVQQPETKIEEAKVEEVQAVEEMPAPIVAAPAPVPTPVAPAPEKKAEKKKSTEEDRAIAHLFGRALGYRAPKMDDANFEMPAVPAESVEMVAAPNPAKAVIEVRQAPVASADTLAGQATLSGDDVNRASAFLENVMAFHRPGGENLSAENLPAREVTVARDTRDVSSLNNIETAAGPTFAPSIAAPVVEQQPAAAPMRREVSGGLIGLEALLERAGISSRQEAASQPGLRQWTSGSYNGLFETVPSSGGDMEGAVRQYLSRYQQDCPQKLDINVSGIERRQAGEVVRAQAVCTMNGNDYATSFVFLRNAQGLQALLHAGSSSDASSLSGISTSIASVLDSVDGISMSSQGAVASVPVSYVPERPQVVTNQIKDSVIERPRRTIEIDAPAAVSPQGHDLPTTVIE